MIRKLALATSLIVVVSCGGGPSEPAHTAAQEPSAPAVVEATVAAADGVEIAYSVRGSGEPTLVFIHGWSCDAGYWAPQLEAFAPTHRVVAIDLPGHGRSGLDRAQWTLASYGDDVARVVEHLGAGRLILVGHSMGAPVAVEAARRLPLKVAGVVAVDALHDTDFEWDEQQWAGWVASLEADFPAACDPWVRSMFPESSDPALADRVAADMCSAPPEVAIALMREFPRWDAKAALAAAGGPVRCINAPQFPTNVEGNRRFAPDFDAVIVDGVGHFLMMEKPAEFNSRLAEVIAGLG